MLRRYRVFNSDFAMNSVVLFIFMLVGATILANPFVLYKDIPNASLAIIKKRDSSALKLAIPRKLLWDEEDNKYADYSYHESEDEKFMVACPASSKTERDFEDEWKKVNNVPENSKLFILQDYTSDSCASAGTPSIEKAPKTDSDGRIIYCGDFDAEIYNVGFPVSNMKSTTDFQFIPVYRVCYSPVEGTRYTIHRIESPSLLLQDEVKYQSRSADNLFKCFLDKCDINEQLLYKNKYGYQFVGIDDMPTKVWGSTTRFSFNYLPIIKNDEDVMKAMLLIDNFIRLYSKMTNKPLTLYSGIYHTIVNQELFTCLPTVLCNNFRPTEVNLFWRIIMDDERLAITIVTQYTKMKCVHDRFLCDNDHRTMITEYKKGGCTYLCPVNKKLIRQLGLPRTGTDQLELPRLNETGYLQLKFLKITQTDSTVPEEGQSPSVGKSYEYVSISDIFGKGNSPSVLEKTDPNLAASIRVRVPRIEKK